VKKILIIQTAFLGDVILATPVISELKRIFPNSEIDFLVRKGNESLLNNNPHLQKVFILNKSEGKFKSIFHLIKQLNKEKYELIINLHRFGSSGLITTFTKASQKFGFKKNPFSFFFTKTFDHTIGNGQHEVERNLSLIKEFGAVTKKRPELYPSEEDFSIVSQIIQSPFYCIAPASVWYTKQLPIEKWIELINHYNQIGTVYILGGKGDQELCEDIISKTISKTSINLAGQLNLLESAALMSKAKRNFVNDSGPLHIASAMNAPVTAFFCSTVTSFGFGPLSEDFIIREVQDLDCRPCGLHGHKTCPKGHFKCGNNIDLALDPNEA
jgi:lipopolysaccharide heptosyltransferase II